MALCYEGLPWFTGAAVMSQTFPNFNIVVIASLYAVGAHGIMTLNDFKALEGDKQTGINSLPVKFGPDKAAKIACWVMTTPQLIVVMLMASWGAIEYAIVVSCLVAGQFVAMRRLLRDLSNLHHGIMQPGIDVCTRYDGLCFWPEKFWSFVR